MPRSYPPEYRRRVLDLLESGKSVTEVAAGLEVTAQTIYNWWNQHLTDTGRKAGVTTIESTELVAARRWFGLVANPDRSGRDGDPGWWSRVQDSDLVGQSPKRR